jgi:hypothetical protein
MIGGTMSTATTANLIRREPELLGQTVVVIAVAPASVSKLPGERALKGRR